MIRRLFGLSVLFSVLFLSTVYSAKQPVVLELMTATWCPACPYAEEAVTQLIKKYGDSLIVLEYHPTSDEFGTDRTESRIEYYSPPGLPTAFFNGIENFVGGGPTMTPFYDKKIQPLMNQNTGIEISLTGNIEKNTVNTTATISLDKKTSIAGMTLRWILYENDAKGAKKNYQHVVRDFSDTYATVKPGSQKTLTHTFQIPKGVNSKNLGIVLLIQDDGSKEIVQGSSILLFPAKSI